MNYYEPKQRESDGRWDFTKNNRPAGYCHAFRPFEQDFIENFHISDREVEKHNKFADKYHSDGHTTSEEACECYKQYMLDHQLQFHESSTEQRKCQICGEWTTKYATLDCEMHTLCDAHCNREELEKLCEAPTFIMASW